MLHNEKNSDCKQKPLIFYSALDWGLGHTTRSIVIIQEFLNHGCKVVVACNSTQKNIFKREFDNIEFVHLGGYNIKYGRNGVLTRGLIVSQLPEILTKVKNEKRWLDDFLAKNEVNAVVSDNRYGLSSPKVPSVFITHQLEPKTGMGSLANNFIRKSLYKYINKFSECWVPDYGEGSTLAGELSHPERSPAIPLKYLGPISRLNKSPFPTDNIHINKLLVILSGPEPQRSIFEEILIRELKTFKQNAVLIRGLPGNTDNPEKLSGIHFFNHVTTDELIRLTAESAIIICRSGYSSIMDMLLLKKKMIIVPTPGQPEQEYLGEYLLRNMMAVTVSQKKFSLLSALELAENFDYNFPEKSGKEYKKVIEEFVLSL